MDETMFWKTAHVILIVYVMSVRTLDCITFYKTSVTCKPEQHDYILSNKLVSTNNDTITLILKSCRIIKIEPNAFENSSSLKQIDLSQNKISELRLGTLDAIKNLNSLRIHHNNLTKLPLGLFKNNFRLKYLDLSYNHIKFFDVGIFDPLTQLLSLKLVGNGLLGKNLNESLFESNLRMTILHFSNNDMSDTPEGILTGLEDLIHLELNNCSLSEMPKFVTTPILPNLTLLQMKSNKINSIDDPNTFINLLNLKTLELSGNMIEKLTVSVFSPLRKLESLLLSFNRIDAIPENFFISMPRIVSIDLSYNFIDTIPVNAFRGSRLKELYINGNRISFLDSMFIQKLKTSNAKLTTFHFNDNPFQCACLLEIIKEVKNHKIKYKSDRYDGEHVVCTIANEFTCNRENKTI